MSKPCLYFTTAAAADLAMGRRKSKRGPGPKRKNIEPLDILFNCPFCNHERSCEVKVEKGLGVGRIWCTVCGEDFQVRSK